MGHRDASGGLVGETALDKMGSTKTVPYLVRTIETTSQKESSWHRVYRTHYHEIPSFVRKHLADPASQIPNDLTRNRAAYYLARLGSKKDPSAEAAIPKLVALLDDRDGPCRFCAANALTGFGKDAASALPVIIRLLKTDATKVNYPMFELLEKSEGPETIEAIPTLRANLNRTNAFLQIGCAMVLWKLDHAQADVVRPVVLRLSAGEDPGTRIECASLLWQMDKNPDIVTPILTALLNDDSHPYDYRTMLLLEDMGPESKATKPALSAWLQRNRSTKPAFVVKLADKVMDTIIASEPKAVPQ